jgi:membrane protein DedA with SNARE-associated domain
MAHLGVVNVHTALVVCLGAVLGGDTLAFLLGTFFGARILKNQRFHRLFAPRKQLRVRAYFRKYGSKVIFIGRFLPGLRFSIFFSAGTLRVRPATFFIYDAMAAVLSVPALVYLAWFFGEHIDAVASWARRSEYGILVVASVAALLIVLKTYRRRRHRRLAGQPPAAMTAPEPRPPAVTPAPRTIPPTSKPLV